MADRAAIRAARREAALRARVPTGFLENPADQPRQEAMGGVKNPANVPTFFNDPERVARRQGQYQQALQEQRQERLGVQVGLARRFGVAGTATKAAQKKIKIIKKRKPAAGGAAPRQPRQTTPATVGGGGSGGAAPRPNPQGTVNVAQASVRSVSQIAPRPPRKAVLAKSPLEGRPQRKPRKQRAVEQRSVQPSVRTVKPLRRKVMVKEEGKKLKLQKKIEKETRTAPKAKEKTKAAEGTVNKRVVSKKPAAVQTAPRVSGAVKGETTRPVGRGIQSAEGTIGNNRKKKSMRY